MAIRVRAGAEEVTIEDTWPQLIIFEKPSGETLLVSQLQDFTKIKTMLQVALAMVKQSAPDPIAAPDMIYR